MAVVLVLNGCTMMRKPDEPTVASAAPLDPLLVKPSIFSDPAAVDRINKDKKDYLGAVILDSIHKCQAFVNTLDLAEGDANFLGDSFSTLFSALATVATPINTVHGLSAAATISSGTKNAYLSGYFANATIANFGMAMQTTYLISLQQYIEALPDMDDADIVVPLEVGKIESFHTFCSMASAQYIITKTLGNAAAKQTTGNISVQLDFDGKDSAKFGDQAKMTVTLSNGSGKAATLSDDMPVTITSDPAGLKLKGTSFANSSCSAQQIVVADDEKSISLQKSAAIPSGGCTIRFSITSATAVAVTAEVKAGALKTDQGSNANGAGPKTINFTSDGKPPKGAAAPAAPGPAPGPGPAAAPAAPAQAKSRPRRSVTHSCVPKALGENPCAN